MIDYEALEAQEAEIKKSLSIAINANDTALAKQLEAELKQLNDHRSAARAIDEALGSTDDITYHISPNCRVSEQ